MLKLQIGAEFRAFRGPVGGEKLPGCIGRAIYMIIRASLLILATIAALAASSNGVVKPSRKRKPRLQSSEDKDANRGSRHAEEEEETETADANRRLVIARQDENPNGVDEAEETKHLLNELRRREIVVEHKLLELYGLREQHSFIAHLKRQLRVRSSEADVLKATISSLEAKKNDLKKEIKESFVAEKQLETAEETIQRCRAKLNASGIQMKAQLEMIEEQVYGYHSKGKPSREPTFEEKTKTMDDVKLEVLAVNRRNKELELEKRELALKLNSARATASLSTMTEGKAIAGAEEEVSALKHWNENLLKQIEMLQKQRYGIVEELVYQKWVKSCLRFEIRDYQTPPPRTPKHDSSKDWSLGSRQKPKSTSRAASDSASSSQTSTESHEIDDTSSTLDSTSGGQSSISKRTSLITRIKRWRNKSKKDIMADQSPDRSPGKRFSAKPGLIQRFSTSVVPQGLSKARWNLGISASRKMSKKHLAESPSPEIRSRPRRVSFNDCVGVRNLEPSFEDTLTPVEMEPYDRNLSRMLSTESRDNAVMVEAKEKAQKHQDVTASEAIGSTHRSAHELEQNEMKEQVADKIGPARSPEVGHGLMNQIEAHSLHVVSAFIIFILALLLVPRFCSWLFCKLTAD